MVTLDELKKENERLRTMQSKLNEIRKNNEDRKNLLIANKRLSRNIKHGEKIMFAKSLGRGFAQVGKTTGKGLLRTGKGAVKGLTAYANFLAEQEARQRILNRKLKNVKVSKRKAIKKSRKKKR